MNKSYAEVAQLLVLIAADIRRHKVQDCIEFMKQRGQPLFCQKSIV